MTDSESPFQAPAVCPSCGAREKSRTEGGGTAFYACGWMVNNGIHDAGEYWAVGAEGHVRDNDRKQYA